MMESNTKNKTVKTPRKETPRPAGAFRIHKPCLCAHPINQPYRVFISYNHADQKWLKPLQDHLKRIGVFSVVDHQIRIGEPFADEIKEMIECSHVFMPLITTAANKRLWVQQEIGYASALHVPYCPIWIEDQNETGEVSGMTSQIQGIVVSAKIFRAAKWKNQFGALLRDKLTYQVIDGIVDSAKHQMARVKQAVNFFDRQQLLLGFTKAANRDSCRFLCPKAIAKTIPIDERPWKLRISAAYGSFSIPDKPLADQIWTERDSGRFQSASERALLRNERQLLEDYAKRFGCDLFIDPWAPTRRPNGAEMKHPPLQRAIRLKLLIDFIRKNNSDRLRVIVVDKKNICLRNTNLLIVGDWFSAEAVVPVSTAGGYEHTLFTRHAPTVLNQIEAFDRFFNDYLSKIGKELCPSQLNRKAIGCLTRMLKQAQKEAAAISLKSR